MASKYVDKVSSADSITVIVRFRSHQKSYELGRCSTIGELRQQLAVDFSVPITEMRILLGGSLLAEDTTIEDSGVGMESMLFAIQCKTTSTTPPTMSSGQMIITTPSLGAGGAYVRPGGNSSSVATQGGDTRRTASSASKADYCPKQLVDQYFVYCKLCGGVRPGRLRVKCSICDGGAVLIDKGPGNWEDVLIPGNVSGSCQSLHCEDCIPLFYFKCAEQHSGDVSDTAIALRHIRPNRHSVLCITCEDVMNPVVVFPCDSSHVMCLYCFMTYCSVRLHERHFVHSRQYGYTLSCPAECPDSFIQEQHHFCIMGTDQYNRYKDFAAEECLLAEGGVYCPRQECSSGFFVDEAETRVICPDCKHLFCRTCRKAPHPNECHPESQMSEPLQAFSDPRRAEQAQWEQQTAHTIQETTKACPGCATRTERDGGCMHMRCARCGEQWCWLCVKSWDRQCQGAHWFG